jgi:hypothetical protein
MRPSCTGSTELAISISFRAAVFRVGERAGFEEFHAVLEAPF